MRGTRLPDAVMGVPGPGWEAWGGQPNGCGELTAPPGAYMKVWADEVDGREWTWYVRAPNGDIATLMEEHAVAEHDDDGTITVSPSIVFPHGGGWHGFLRRGIWS